MDTPQQPPAQPPAYLELLQSYQGVLDAEGCVLSASPALEGLLKGTDVHAPLVKRLVQRFAHWGPVFEAAGGLPASGTAGLFLPLVAAGSDALSEGASTGDAGGFGLRLKTLAFNSQPGLKASGGTPGIFGSQGYSITLHPDMHVDAANTQNPQSIGQLRQYSDVLAQLVLRLQLSESRLDNYMHNFPGIFFCQRPDLSFTYLGPKLSEALGAPTDALLKNGGAFLGLIDPRERAYFMQELSNNSPRAKTFSMSYRLRRNPEATNQEGGALMYVLDVRTPLYSPSGLLLGYEGVWLDITRQAIAENRLSSTAWRENIATLTGGLVHDFSNLMAGIHSLSELHFDKAPVGSELKEGMGHIKKGTLQAQSLVRRIIALNRDEQGHEDYHNFEAVVKDQLYLVNLLLGKRAEIVIELTGEELPVYIDEVALRQMLLNFALNARDALPKRAKPSPSAKPEDPLPGLPTVNISVRKVPEGSPILTGTFAGEETAPALGLELIFEDAGAGIDTQHLAKVFAPFFTTKEATKGSGFGLYNAKRFVEASRGRLGVRSQLGQGTALHVYLPQATFTEKTAADEAAQAEDKDAPRILVYAMEDPGSFELPRMLRQKGWEVVCFDAPERALHYLGQAEVLPQLVLCVDMGADAALPPLLENLSTHYPGIRVALELLGRNPDESVPEALEAHVDFSCTEAMPPSVWYKKLTDLVS